MKINEYEEADVSIIDYGINNLKSVSMAFQKIGKSYRIIDKSNEVLSAKSLILPGIGAFGDGMKNLKKRGLIESIKKKVKAGTPFLGICLGMQMLFTESHEFGLHKGLDLIPGRVIPFKPPNEVNIKGYKVPHMGWNELLRSKSSEKQSKNSGSIWKNTLLDNIKEHSDVYFVHSYYPIPENDEEVLATTIYGDQEFCAVVKKNNVNGTQFHPEKSGIIGLNILKNFCNLYNI